MTTRVGLFRGGNGGVLSPLVVTTGVLFGVEAMLLTLELIGAFLTVATLAFDPIESLLEAILSLDGEDVPLLPLCIVEMLSVDADMPLTFPSSVLLIRLVSVILATFGTEVDVARPKRSPLKVCSKLVNVDCVEIISHYL